MRKQRAARGGSNPVQYDHNNLSFNSGDYSGFGNLNQSAITQARKASYAGNNPFANNDGNQTAISGGRKPTADSLAYPVYKQNKGSTRGRFSNGGGSIAVANNNEEGLDGGENLVNIKNFGYKGLPTSNIMKQERANNSFNNAGNTTASRFYNPNKGNSPSHMMNDTQSRFMSNLQNNRKGGGQKNTNGVF